MKILKIVLTSPILIISVILIFIVSFLLKTGEYLLKKFGIIKNKKS